MNSLFENKIAFVAGGDIGIISSVVRTFLLQKAKVIVPAKSVGDVEKLKASLTDIDTIDLITLVTDYPDYYKASEIAETIMEEFGKLDFVVIFLHTSRVSSAITDTTIIDWEKMIDDQITTYFVAARIVFSAMSNSPHSMFVSISDQYRPATASQSDLAALSSAMQQQMAVMFAEQFRTKHIRFHHVFIPRPADGQDTTIDAAMIGPYIMRLYNGEVEESKSLFHFLHPMLVNS